MKRFSVILAMMLALFPMLGALGETVPQTKEGTIYLEGMPETITLTLFESERGYRLWYDANMFAFVPAEEGNDVDTFKPASPDALDGVSLSVNFSAQLDYTLEDAGADVQKSLTENGFTVTSLDTNEIFPAYQSFGFHGVKGSSIVDKYIVSAEEGQYYITAEYPLEAAEGFGGRLRYVVSTFEIMGGEQE
jgi:hypothetical protein